MSSVSEFIDLIDRIEEEVCCKHAVHEHVLTLLEETFNKKVTYYHQALSFLRKKIINDELITPEEKIKLIERLQTKS